MNTDGQALPIQVINKEIFDKEISMCRKLHRENSGKCNWGICSSCGVIPLLYKLYDGRLLEDSEGVKEAKDKIFNR